MFRIMSKLWASMLGMFSDTLLMWREPSKVLNCVVFKESGVKTIAGRNVAWSAYNDIECCNISKDTVYTVLEFVPKKRRVFTIFGTVTRVLVPDDGKLEAALDILRRKG